MWIRARFAEFVHSQPDIDGYNVCCAFRQWPQGAAEDSRGARRAQAAEGCNVSFGVEEALVAEGVEAVGEQEDAGHRPQHIGELRRLLRPIVAWDADGRRELES